MTTLYFAGGEDTSFATLNTFSMGTLSGSWRTAFSRGAVFGVYYPSGPPAAWPPNMSAVTPNLGALSNFWVHGQNIKSAGSSGTFGASSVTNANYSGTTMLGVADSSGVGRILVRGTGTAGQLKISTRNAAGTIVDLATTAAGAFPVTAFGTPVAIDLFVNYAVSGQCTLYINGANVADTGPGVNITTDGTTSLSEVYYSTCAADTYGTVWGFWSECIVQSTSTLGMALQTIPPVAAGNTQSWLPNTVGNINETTINDANFIAATAANALSEWTVSTSLPAGSWTITAVAQEARVSVGLTGPQHFEWLQRTSDGTDHVNGSVAPTTSLSNFQNILPLNPHTGAAWNAGELINSGIESLA